MCVICHKPRGVELPKTEVFEKCFSRNPDGSGILLVRKDSKLCEIHKGMMKIDDFKTVLSELNPGVDDELVLHFRITTSGGTNPENCHPFPISSRVEDLKATRINVPMAFVHNGVLGKGDDAAKISDTQLLVRDVLSRPEICNYLENPEIQKLIKEIAGTGNKFFVADPTKGIFERFGLWVEDTTDSKCWFSNMLWKNSYSYSTYSSGYSRKDAHRYSPGWGGWDDDYAYGGYGSRYGSGSKGKDSYSAYGYGSYSRGSYYHGTYDYPKKDDSSSKGNRKKQDPATFDTMLCPYCDCRMENLLKGTDFFICHSCGTVYDDKTFSIYEKKNREWKSIVDINDFEGNQGVFC